METRHLAIIIGICVACIVVGGIFLSLNGEDKADDAALHDNATNNINVSEFNNRNITVDNRTLEERFNEDNIIIDEWNEQEDGTVMHLMVDNNGIAKTDFYDENGNEIIPDIEYDENHVGHFVSK